jgi:hypothetical protein
VENNKKLMFIHVNILDKSPTDLVFAPTLAVRVHCSGQYALHALPLAAIYAADGLTSKPRHAHRLKFFDATYVGRFVRG